MKIRNSQTKNQLPMMLDIKQSLRGLLPALKAVWKLPGTGFCLVFAALLICAYVLSLLQGIDLGYYKFMQKTQGWNQDADHQVLLIETKPEAIHDWPLITQKMLTAGAQQVVFLILLDSADKASLSAIQHKVILGYASEAQLQAPGKEWSPNNDPASHVALIASPPDAEESQTTQHSHYLEGSKIHITAEAAAAANAGRNHIPAEYMINPRLGSQLPRISAERVEREPPIPELAQGKTVVIGFAHSPMTKHYFVSGQSGYAMSALEYHGLALDTLLLGKEVRRVNPWVAAVLIVAYGLAVFLVFQRLRQLPAALVALASLVGLALAAWLALLLIRRWMPLVELSLITAGVFAGVYSMKDRNDKQSMRLLLNSITSKLQSRQISSGFSDSQDHWKYVSELVDQALQLNRNLFLERVPDENRVREVHALRCSINDLAERRRDIERRPYTVALEKKRMVEINTAKRPFMANNDTSERQFLVPLSFAGHILGFWAFSLKRDKIGSKSRFRTTVASIAEQVGMLLYQRQVWLSQHACEQHTVQSYFKDSGVALQDTLAKSVAAFERILARYEATFAESATAAMVFDMFGRTQFVNKRMHDLLYRAGIAPFDMAAADFIAKIACLDPQAAEKSIRVLIMDGKPLSLEAKLPGMDQRQFALNARSMQSAGDDQEAEIPFRTHGILLELIDITEYSRVYTARSSAAQHLCRQIKSDLTALTIATQELVATSPGNTEIFTILKGQLRITARTLNQAQTLLAQPVDITNTGISPLDLQHALSEATQSLQGKFAQRGLKVKMRTPAGACFVHANPAEMVTALEAMLRLLADDAASDSEISLTVRKRKDSVDIELGNSGYGIPQDRLDAILRSDNQAENELFANLRRALSRIVQWGGSGGIRSELGVGYRINVRLRAFR